LIEWERGFPVVTFKIAMVEIMKVGTSRNAGIPHGTLESDVATGGGQSAVLKIEQHVHGVAEDQRMRRYARKINQVFSRMHRHSTPWARVRVLVVEIMDRVVDRFPMDHSVSPIKMKFPHNGMSKARTMDHTGCSEKLKKTGIFL